MEKYQNDFTADELASLREMIVSNIEMWHDEIQYNDKDEYLKKELSMCENLLSKLSEVNMHKITT